MPSAALQFESTLKFLLSAQLTAVSRRTPHAVKLEIADISLKAIMQARKHNGIVYRGKKALKLIGFGKADKNGSVLEGICKSGRNAK
ncbi:unnamed protein product [Dovyalis caffra]|uniref:Uncharacterized protein n=1 Tax=Dovyalis caffra TaxID=77055 RepID=A0AAV1R1K5_9ROSI|nr:unnamed protein product [Dovyalis caffra]